MALATPRLKSGAAAKATAPQGSPSALPVAAPAPRGELSYGSLISRTAAASCVFLYFSFLPAAFFGAPPPMKDIVRRKARAAEEFLQQRASRAICEGVLWGG